MDDDWYRESRRPRKDQSMEPVRSSDWKRWKGAHRMGIVQLSWPCRKVFEEAGKRWKIVQEFDNYTTILHTKDNEDWEKYPMKKELLCSFGPLMISTGPLITPTPLILIWFVANRTTFIQNHTRHLTIINTVDHEAITKRFFAWGDSEGMGKSDQKGWLV